MLALGFNFTFYILPTALFFWFVSAVLWSVPGFRTSLASTCSSDMILICFPHQHMRKHNYLVCDQILGSSRFYAFKTAKAAF